MPAEELPPAIAAQAKIKRLPFELKWTVTARVVDGGLRSSDREPVWAPS
jgi:hypothetical protein